MDIVKILSNIRQLRIISRMNILDENLDRTKYIVKHSNKNLIDIDTENSISSEDSVCNSIFNDSDGNIESNIINKSLG
jgi:hypothetical protein